MERTTYSGFTEATAENLLLDAGAFFINFDVDTDTFATAIAGNKLLGATRGGGNFSAIPSIRPIEIDGVKGAAKGLQVIDEWVTTLTSNVLEVTKEGLAKALAASEVDSVSNEYYHIIKAKNYIELEDYIENITYVGKLSGAEQPVIIQVYNVLNTQGLTLQTQDKNEAVIAMTFTGHYDAEELDNPPFAIFYPKVLPKVEIMPTTATFTKNNAADIEFTVTGATVTGVTLENIAVADTNYTIEDGKVTLKKEYLTTLENEDHIFSFVTAIKTVTATVTVEAGE